MSEFEALSKIEQGIVQMYAWIMNLVTSMNGQILMPFLTWTEGEALLVIVNEVYEYLIIVGVGMLIIYFLAELNKTLFMAGNNMTMQHLFNPLIKLAAGYIVITKGGTIIGYFLAFNNVWIDWLGDDLGVNLFDGENTQSGEMSEILNMVNDLGTVGSCIAVIPMFLMLVATLIIAVVMIYKAVIWKIELAIRLALAPISLGDIYDGKNGNAVRYLKKILSMVLYAGGIILVLKFGGTLYMSMMTDTSAFLGSFLDLFSSEDTIWHDYLANTAGTYMGVISLIPNIVTALLVPLAELGCMKAVKQICDDALG